MSNNSSGQKIFGVETAFLWLLVLPAGVLLLFFLSLFFVIFPRIGLIQEMSKNAANTNKMTKDVQDKIAYLSSINPTDLKQNADRLNSAIFAEKNSYFLIDIIRGIADQYGFQIQSFTLSPGEVKQEETSLIKKTAVDAVTKIPVNITLVGPKDKYLDFIEAIEKNLPILSMDKFQFTTEANSVKLDLILSSYYIPTLMVNDISKLTLADLTLSSDESNLIKKLSAFTKLPSNTVVVGVGITSSQGFVKYTRPNPFVL